MAWGEESGGESMALEKEESDAVTGQRACCAVLCISNDG